MVCGGETKILAMAIVALLATACAVPIRTVNTTYEITQEAQQLPPTGSPIVGAPLSAGSTSLAIGGSWTTNSEDKIDLAGTPQGTGRLAVGMLDTLEGGISGEVGAPGDPLLWRGGVDLRATIHNSETLSVDFVTQAGISAAWVSRTRNEVTTTSEYGTPVTVETIFDFSEDLEFIPRVSIGPFVRTALPADFAIDFGLLGQTVPVYKPYELQNSTCNWFSDGRMDCDGRIRRGDPRPMTGLVATPVVSVSKTIEGVELSAQAYMHIGEPGRQTPVGLQGLVVFRPKAKAG